jgi:hypothetical protein
MPVSCYLAICEKRPCILPASFRDLLSLGTGFFNFFLVTNEKSCEFYGILSVLAAEILPWHIVSSKNYLSCMNSSAAAKIKIPPQKQSLPGSQKPMRPQPIDEDIERTTTLKCREVYW